MQRILPAIVAIAVVAVAMPVIARADHKPGHEPGQPKPPGVADLTLAAQPNLTVFEGSTVLSGRLKGPDNAGKSVVLRADGFPFGNGFKDVATTTDGKGDYTFTRRPARNTSYQAIVGTTVSPAVLVKVRIRMSLRVSDATPRVGQLVRFRGRACPPHDGLPVRIQRKTATGAFVTVRRTTLRGSTTCSTYTRRFRVYRDATYRITSDDADHARGFSRERFLNTPG